jgi:O-antigen/teichoic acid export membrane protein
VSIITSLLRYSIALGFFINGYGLNGIFLGFVISDAFGVILFVFALAPKFFGTKINVSSFYFEIRPIIKFALSSYALSILYNLLNRIDVYLLSILTTPYVVGIYGPAAFVGSTFLVLLTSVDQALMPFMSRIYGKHGTSSFKSSAVQASRFLLLFFFPLGFAVAASSPTLVTVLLGSRFAESAYPMAIIIAGIVLFSPGLIANNLLRSAGYTGVALKASTAALLLQVVILLIMIPQFGILGASAARFVGYIVLAIPLLYSLHVIGGLDFDRQSLKYGLIGSGIISLEIIAIGAEIKGPASLILQYTIAFFSYLLLLRITHVLNHKDVEIVDETFMGKLKWLTVPLSKILVRES